MIFPILKPVGATARPPCRILTGWRFFLRSLLCRCGMPVQLDSFYLFWGGSNASVEIRAVHGGSL